VVGNFNFNSRSVRGYWTLDSTLDFLERFTAKTDCKRYQGEYFPFELSKRISLKMVQRIEFVAILQGARMVLCYTKLGQSPVGVKFLRAPS
jgi:hypothetical protein